MRISVSLLSLAALTLATAIMAPLGRAADDPAAQVQRRIDLMKQNGENLGKIVAVARGDKPFEQSVVEAAKASWDYSKSVVSLFPDGSTTPESRAMPEIWTKKEEFKQAASVLEAATGKLYEITKTGDVAAIRAQLKEVGSACDGCHEKFRKPK